MIDSLTGLPFDQENIDSFTKKENSELIDSDSWIKELYDAYAIDKTIKYYVLSNEILRATGNQRKFITDENAKYADKQWIETSRTPERWQTTSIERVFNSLESIINLEFIKVDRLEKADMPILITSVPNSSSVSGYNNKIRDHVLFMSHQDGFPSPYHEGKADDYKHNAETRKIWSKTLMHEVAHYLGLEHPWGIKDADRAKKYTEDTTNKDAPFKTVMGYNSGFGKYGKLGSIDVFESFQDRDLAALQQIWGRATSTKGIEEMVGTAKNNKLRGKKTAIYLKGMGGNDRLIGGMKDDLLDGGDGNDILTGKRGADKYLLSSGNDEFRGIKLNEGDTIEIASDITYTLVESKKNTIIRHDIGMTTVFKISEDELVSIIEIAP